MTKFFLYLIFVVAFNISVTTFAQTYPAFNLKEWPSDILTPLVKKVPALLNKSFSQEELSQLIKDVHHEARFNQLKIVEKNSELFLVGTLSSKVESINFTGLKEIDDEDALSIMSLSLTDAQDENKITAATERLLTYFKNIGYRKAQANFSLINKSTTIRSLVINLSLGKITKISSVEIDGLTNSDEKFIENEFSWNGKGKVLSDDNLKLVQRSLRKSLNTLGYYLVSTPSPSISFSADELKAKLKFSLLAQPKYKIELLRQRQQNVNSSELSILKPILLNDVLKLDEYYATESNFAPELAEKIRLHYLSEGYARCEVSYFDHKDENLTIITLNINEGPRVTLKNISITGNISREEKYYIEIFKKLSSAKIKDHILIQADIEQASKNLITYLQNEGFVNAKLAKLQIATDNRKSITADINLQIDEGPQAVISGITVAGNNFYSSEKILEVLELHTGQNLNLSELELAINKLKMFYEDNGFIEVKLMTDSKDLIQYSDNLTEARLNFNISEGPQIRVGSILIEGNDMTHAKLILTELDFKDGVLLTPAKIDESTTRLQRTGHFSTVEIYTLEANTNISDRTVIVRVNERKPGVFTAGVGLTNENNATLHGFTGIAYRNIGGWGRGASLRAEGKYNPSIINFLEYKVTAGYLEPYLFDTRLRFRVNYTTSREVSDLSINKVTITNQAVWSVEQDFTSHLTGIYEILNVSNFVDRGITPQDEIDFGYTSDNMVISTTGPTLDLDYRDNILNPQDGHWTRLTLEYSSSSIGNNNVDDFLRTTGQFTLYSPLVQNFGLIWVNSYRAGYVKTLGKNENGVPFDKKGFILGGRSTIRGFESSEFFPTTNLQLPASYKFANYAAFQLIKSEFRFPLFGLENMMGAVFYDGGIVGVDDVIFEDKYRDAAGVGLRYSTPVGPINLEYARKLDRKSYESDGAFHLSVGVF